MPEASRSPLDPISDVGHFGLIIAAQQQAFVICTKAHADCRASTSTNPVTTKQISCHKHHVTPLLYIIRHSPTVASAGLFNLSSLLPSGYSAAINHFFSTTISPKTGAEATDQPLDTVSTYISAATEFLCGRTAFENTSVILAVCTFLYLAMSSWTSRLGPLGRFSPFARSPPQSGAQVTEKDFSYITADDLRNHQNASSSQQAPRAESPIDYGPERDTDMLVLKNKRREYAVHFPAYSIAKGELTVGQVREQAAKKLGTTDTRRVKLLYRGQNLKDDRRLCKHEGLRDGAELMCVFADAMPSASASDDDEEDDEFADLNGDQAGADGEPKRRRNRGKKSRKANKRKEGSGTSTPAEGNLGVPSQSSTRGPSPSRQPLPTTPIGKLNALNDKLQDFMPQVHAFLTSPPADESKKVFEHKKLSETILAQVLLKLDAVESEGDESARLRRKELVRETQKVLSDLDAAVKA